MPRPPPPGPHSIESDSWGGVGAEDSAEREEEEWGWEAGAECQACGHTRDLPCVCTSVRCRTGGSQAYQQGGCSLPPQTPIVGQTLALIGPRREDELSFSILEGKKHKPVEIHIPVPATGSL